MRTLLTLLTLLIITPAIAQNKQSAFSFGYTHQFPIGDLSDRFGDNSAVGFSFFKERESNLFYGIEANYIFGSNVKDSTIFDNISTDIGAIISSDGTYANVILMERGFDAHLFIGYAYHPKKKSLSGFYFSGGIGYLEHKIFIDTKNQSVPQLDEEYKKGYDRYTNGISTKWEASYKYYSKNGKFQFYTGINMTIANTQIQRPYLFDKMEYTTETRSWDNLLGINMGIIIPVHRKNEEEFHYY